MSRSVAPAVLLFGLMAASLASVGCNRDAAAPSLALAAPQQATKDKVVGNWDGKFVFHPNAPIDQFDQSVVAACKSSRIHIEFQVDGRMKMRMTMQFADGEQSHEVQGKWEFIRSEGDAVVIRSTDDGGQPVTLHFRGDHSFDMDGPANPLAELCVMRFTREK